MPVPVLILIDDDADRLASVRTALERRFGADYEVRAFADTSDAVRALRALADDGRRVAVVLVDQATAEGIDPAFFRLVTELHPGVRRGLELPFGDRPAADAVLRAASLGRIDFWTLRPVREPDEEFHAQVTEAIRDWTRATMPPPAVLRVVGERWDQRSHEIRDLFDRNRIPYRFLDVDEDGGRDVLAETGRDGSTLPVIALFDGTSLAAPSNQELAEALGVGVRPSEAAYDVVVIGGGPAGLAASVYATSEGLRTALVEREAMGGQAGTTSSIRNYLGFPRGVSGAELMQRAYEQAWLFGTEFVYTNDAAGLRADGRDRIVTLADGTEVATRAVVLAAGVTYRRLGVTSLEALTGAGVFYGAAVTEATSMAGEDVIVVGGGNSAGQAAVHLARFARRVTLLVRGASLAESMSEYLVRELGSLGNVTIRYGVEVVDGDGRDRLERVTVRDRATGATEDLPAAGLFVLIGAEPRTEWLPDQVARDPWGYVLTGDDVPVGDGAAASWPLERAPMPLETGMPGVFAAGDIRHGSVKRIASAVGEGSIAIRLVHGYLATG